MYGYEPPEEEPGGCRESLVMTRVAFGVLLPPMLVIGGGVTLIMLTIFLTIVHPVLVIIPVLLAAAGIYWFIARDPRAHRELEERTRPPDRR